MKVSKNTKDQKLKEESVKGNELIATIKKLIAKGNVRRLIIRKSNGKKVLEVPLTAGIGISGVLIVIAPVLVAISSVAAVVAEFKVEVIHADDDKNEEKPR